MVDGRDGLGNRRKGEVRCVVCVSMASEHESFTIISVIFDYEGFQSLGVGYASITH
jgi:hypothetical protein